MNALPQSPSLYEFNQLIRLVERQMAARTGDGSFAPISSQHMADRESIRLRATHAMGHSVREVRNDPRRMTANDGEKAEVFADRSSFCGFDGVLPRHISDDIQKQLQEDGRSSIAEFLDVYYHRLVSIAYRSFSHSHLGLEAEQMSLMGQHFTKPTIASVIQLIAHRPQGASYQEVTGCFAFLLNKGRTSLHDLERMLTTIVGKKITIKPFHGRWFPLAPDSKSRFGKNPPVLGQGAVLGSRLYSVQNTLKATIEDLKTSDIEEFFGGTIIATLRKLIGELTGIPYKVDFDLNLHFTDHQATKLGANDGHGVDSGFGSAQSLGLGAVLGSAGGPETFTFRSTRKLVIDL